MNQWTVFISAMILFAFTGMGCSGGGNPLVPGAGLEMSGGSSCRAEQTQTHLWGYCDVIIDIENQTVQAVYDRSVMFTCNVVNFLNSGPIPFMEFHINNLLVEPDYVDIYIDVSITHPFPGMTKFNGYDVRGVFMGDGSAAMEYNPDLVYPVFGTDQFMPANPIFPGNWKGAPDGYTRWFNITEFGDPEMPLFGYTQGKLASADFAGTATLCPYKYFADGLEKDDEFRTWLKENGQSHGVFRAGSANSRKYYLRFPNEKVYIYGYAILANWEHPDIHPSNAPETVGCDLIDNSTVYYIDPDNNGGDLVLDISLFGWGHQPSTIFVESTVLSSPYESDANAMIPIGGGVNYSTYHIEIPADSVTSSGGNEFWIIAEYEGFDYTNEFGVMNDAWEDHLAAFFRYDLPVGFKPRTHLYVDGDNDTGVEDGTEANPYNTIMEAIDAAPTYSLVHVDAVESGNGYYEESVALKTDVWLHGDNWNGGVGKPRIHIISNGGWYAVVPHMEGWDVSQIEVDNFELTTNHFEIEWWGGPENNCFQLMRFKNISDVKISNCRLTTSVSATGVAAIRVVDGSNVIIEHNEIVDLYNTRSYNWSCYTMGIFAWNIQDLVIRQNEIHHLNHQNVHNAGDAFTTWTYGIRGLLCTPGLEITNNLIYDIYDFSEADASHPHPNYYRLNGIHGIFLQGCTESIIANNTLDDFNPVARSGSQAGKLRGVYCGEDLQPPDSAVVKNNIVSNMVSTELTSEPIFFGAGFYGAFPFSVDYSNVYNLDLTNGGAEYYGLAVKGTGSFDNADNQDPLYGGSGPTFYQVGNPNLLSDDGTEMGAFGGPGGDWSPPSQE